MKRILILLVLSCYIFCAENPCFNLLKTAQNAKECASRTLTDKSKFCCIIKMTVKNPLNGNMDEIGECGEFMKGVSEEIVKEYFNNNIKDLIPYTEVSFKSFKCSSSFLKVGFLLSILLLL